MEQGRTNCTKVKLRWSLTQDVSLGSKKKLRSRMNYIIMTGNTVSVCLLMLLSNSSDNYLQLSKSILCLYYLLTLYLILFRCAHFSLLSPSTLMTSTPHLEAAGVEGHRPESSRCQEEWPLFSSSWLPFTSRLANSAVTVRSTQNQILTADLVTAWATSVE